jgi:ribosomal protein S18 acetylase RimI-like enzyme
MSDLTISPVESESELKSFITFPWRVYENDPHWVPPLIGDRKDFLNPEKNPYFKHAEAKYFVARRNGEPVGTIMATSNRLYNEFQEENSGFFGFFEVLDDPEAARELLRTAEEWVRAAGHDKIIGPAQFSTNDEVGLLIDGFDDPPRILMTYNPPRYQTYIEQYGYSKAQDLLAFAARIEDVWKNYPPKLLRVAEKIKKRWNLTVRHLDMKNYDQEVENIKLIYNSSWEKNWGFVPMTDDEITHLAAQLKLILDTDFVMFIEKDGKPIAVGIGLLDLNQPLLKAYPKPGTPDVITLAKMFWNWRVRKMVDWVRIWALGVLPEYHGQGIDAILYLELTKAAYARGIEWGEASWILESNDMMLRPMDRAGAKVYKRYRMYEKLL